MRQITSYILLLGLTIHTILSSGYIIDYYVHIEIYKEQCSNKDKPILQCNGACVLAEKIAISQTPETQDQEMFLPLSYEYTFSVFRIRLAPLKAINLPTGSQTSLYNFQCVSDLLRPPIFPFHSVVSTVDQGSDSSHKA